MIFINVDDTTPSNTCEKINLNSSNNSYLAIRKEKKFKKTDENRETKGKKLKNKTDKRGS